LDTNDNNFTLKDNKIEKVDEKKGKEETKISEQNKNRETKEIKVELRNEINLIYYAVFDDTFQIFGEKFVENNKGNIDLIIGEKRIDLVHKYYFKKGDNKVTIIIKNKLTNLSFMFNECSILKDISELKYLDVSESNSFEGMFFFCYELKDIKPLEN